LIRHPVYVWIPDQVRHDTFGYLIAGLIILILPRPTKTPVASWQHPMVDQA
jgi:hypothetical protein